MELDIFVHYISNNIKNNKKIILNEDIDLMVLQQYLCKMLNNSYIYINYYDNYYNNIIYHCNNNNIFGIIKKNRNIFYIWRIKS